MKFGAVERLKLVEVCLGSRPADIYVRGARILNVYTGEVVEGQSVAILGDKIAYVGESRSMVSGETRVFDASGLTLVPGYVDPHGHADVVTGPPALSSVLIKTGTTTVVSETHDIFGCLGGYGISTMLRAIEGLPINFYLAAPWGEFPYPDPACTEPLTPVEFEAVLGRPEFLSVGEMVPWTRLISREMRVFEKLETAGRLGKRAEGHLTGLSYDKLAALSAAGITSCHESVTAEEALERLRLGMRVMIRCGSIRQDVDRVAAAITDNPGIDTSRVMFTPDWVNPEELTTKGYIDRIIRRAIELGVDPVKAYQMATVNPASYLGIDGEVGGMAPGRRADILFLESLLEPTPVHAMAGGEFIVMERESIARGADGLDPVPLDMWRKHRIPQMHPRGCDFVINLSTRVISLPVITLVDKTVTKLETMELNVVDGIVMPDREKDVMIVAVLNEENEGFTRGFLKGFGARVGGVASSMAHEQHKPLAIGYDPHDMAHAMNRMLELGGGVVVVDGGKVVAELPLPVGGILSASGFEGLRRGYTAVNSYLRHRGCPFDDPIFCIGFLTNTGLPYYRMTPHGIWDVIRRKPLSDESTPVPHS